VKSSKRRYLCQVCGHSAPAWLGRCPACGEWSSFVEERVEPDRDAGRARLSGASGPTPIARLETAERQRLGTGFPELDRVLGGGLVEGSATLLGGEPGIGKSTLVLQVSGFVADESGRVLYVSGEESTTQLKMRADRLGISSERLLVLTETDVYDIEACVEEVEPRLLIVDSIQTVHLRDLESAPGGVSQVRESAARLLALAKRTGCSVVLVGHVSKTGALAGPKVLEHIVDAVLYFEGERHQSYRLLRADKNRFGSTNEVGIFEMGDAGLSEVDNPSKALLAERARGASGSVVVAAIEGTRPLLAELQALVSPCSFGVPRRTASGVDRNRLALVIAVLEKRIGLRLGSQDTFVKVTGGLDVSEPAADLGMALAIASSYYEAPVPEDLAAVGEVGLAGEVRSVGRVDRRVEEAGRLGFSRVLVPASIRLPTERSAARPFNVATVGEALEIALEGWHR